MTSIESTEAPLSRREKKAVETRAAILAAACQLIERDGYDATTIERIAEEADIAPRTFFRYFPNKEAVLFAEFDAARQAMVVALKARPRDEDVLESIAVILKRFSIEIDLRRDEFAWVREVTGAYEMTRSPDRIVASQEVHAEVAEFIADRLDVDTATDPRPAAWAKSVLAAFGQAVLLGPHPSDGGTFGVFVELLGSTSQALLRLETVCRTVDDHEHGALLDCHER